MDPDGERRTRHSPPATSPTGLIKLSMSKPDFKRLSVTIGNTPSPYRVCAGKFSVAVAKLALSASNEPPRPLATPRW
jgi:hypothetical protein